jgi:L-threonylcarbamoyladenylate synthase
VAATVLPTHTPALFQHAVREAVTLLRAGRVVALPTETVYGLAANALDPAAVAQIYAIKGRPAHNPLIVHAATPEMTRQCVTAWPEAAGALARAFWPGPLTLVLPKANIIPETVTAGGATVAVRWPSHPLMQAVIRACGFPLAAPSAHPSNQISPTSAEHVRAQLGERLELIIDGGQAQVGIESTVLDLTVHPPRLLRPGMIHAETLAATLGQPVASGPAASERGDTLKSPGQLEKHYSPRARLILLHWHDDAELRARIAGLEIAPQHCRVIAHTTIPASLGSANVSLIPHDPEAFARALYAELHRCDQPGVRLIVVEAPPETAEWAAIRDRLQRAAAV